MRILQILLGKSWPSQWTDCFPHLFRLVYVICNDCDGKFQSPPDMDNSIQDSIKRLQTASLVWQSCMAQLLLEQGHGRKTFRWEHI